MPSASVVPYHRAMARHTFVLLGSMPIPVGHRVQVHILSRDMGVFSKDIQAQLKEPLVRDLDTGIYYGRLWHCRPTVPSAIGFDEPRSPQPADGVAIAETFDGRIVECVVLSENFLDKQGTQTTLVVDIDEGADEAVALR